MPRQSSRLQRTLTDEASSPPPGRPRRAATNLSTSITRDPSDSSEDAQKSLSLTLKMAPSRLREATSARDTPEPESAISSRSTRNKPRKSYVMESESDNDEDEDAEGEEDVEVDPEDMEEDQPVSAQEEDEEEDEDEEDDEMDDDADDGLPLGGSAPAPAPFPTPSLKIKGPKGPVAPQQPKVTVTPAKDTNPKSVEQKELEMDDDDEELSELGSDEDEEEGEDEDAEGEEDDEEMEDVGDDSRSPDAGSRASTPDVTKMTKRQRSRLDQVMGGDFLQLPMEPQIKKHFTPEEHAMRRAEMARRRKNLSEKRNEEEKADTINRLLKKQAPKRRGKISQAEIEAQDRGDDEEEGWEVGEVVQPANPVFVRWVSDAKGCRVGVPGEWLGTPVGRVFGGGGGVGGGKMVEEVEG